MYFEGNRIFQHRNMAKWDLLGENPRIPGFLYEQECREFLAELRGMWNGRLHWKPPMRKDMGDWEWRERGHIVRDLRKGVWLFEDRRPQAGVCCGPLDKWSAQRKSKPWEICPSPPQEAPTGSTEGMEISAGMPADGSSHSTAAEAMKRDPMAETARGLRCWELGFIKDGAIGAGARKDFCLRRVLSFPLSITQGPSDPEKSTTALPERRPTSGNCQAVVISLRARHS